MDNGALYVMTSSTEIPTEHKFGADQWDFHLRMHTSMMLKSVIVIGGEEHLFGLIMFNAQAQNQASLIANIMILV